MGTTNFGSQTITFDYKQPALSEDFNKLNYKLIEPGIYDWDGRDAGGEPLSILSNALIRVSSMTFFIEDAATGNAVRIDTSLTYDLSVNSAVPYAVWRYTWSNTELWYADLLAVAFTDIEDGDVVIGRAVFSGSTLTGFDYTRRSVASTVILRDEEKELQALPTEPVTNTVFVTAGGAQVEGSWVDFSGDVSPAFSSTGAGEERIDIVVLDPAGNLAVIEGQPAASNPIAPEYRRFTVAEVHFPESTSFITGDMIKDVRSLYSPADNAKIVALGGADEILSSDVVKYLSIENRGKDTTVVSQNNYQGSFYVRKGSMIESRGKTFMVEQDVEVTGTRAIGNFLYFDDIDQEFFWSQKEPFYDSELGGYYWYPKGWHKSNVKYSDHAPHFDPGDAASSLKALNTGRLAALDEDTLVQNYGKDQYLAIYTKTPSAYKNDSQSWEPMEGVDFTNPNATGRFIYRIRKLSSNRVVIVSYESSTNVRNLYALEWDGSSWTLVSDILTGSSFYNADSVVVLSDNRISLYDSGLKVYDLVSSTWTQVGNTLVDSDADGFAARLSDTSIAVANTANQGTLAKLNFDGTDWSVDGSPYTVFENYTDIGNAQVVGLDSSNILLRYQYSASGENISEENLYRRYTFNGTTWELDYSFQENTRFFIDMDRFIPSTSVAVLSAASKDNFTLAIYSEGVEKKIFTVSYADPASSSLDFSHTYRATSWRLLTYDYVGSFVDYSSDYAPLGYRYLDQSPTYVTDLRYVKGLFNGLSQDVFKLGTFKLIVRSAQSGGGYETRVIVLDPENEFEIKYWGPPDTTTIGAGTLFPLDEEENTVIYLYNDTPNYSIQKLKYDFDTESWTQIGNTYTETDTDINLTSTKATVAFRKNYLVVQADDGATTTGSGRNVFYYFDGTDWTKIQNSAVAAASMLTALVLMSGSVFMGFTTDSSDYLRMRRYYFTGSGLASDWLQDFTNSVTHTDIGLAVAAVSDFQETPGFRTSFYVVRLGETNGSVVEYSLLQQRKNSHESLDLAQLRSTLFFGYNLVYDTSGVNIYIEELIEVGLGTLYGTVRVGSSDRYSMILPTKALPKYRKFIRSM